MYRVHKSSKGKSRNVVPAKYCWSTQRRPDGPIKVEGDFLNKCPRCEGYLVSRVGPYSKFFGCVNYPRCRYNTSKIFSSVQTDK